MMQPKWVMMQPIRVIDKLLNDLEESLDIIKELTERMKDWQSECQNMGAKLRTITELVPEIRTEIQRGIKKCNNEAQIKLSVELLDKLNKWVEK